MKICLIVGTRPEIIKMSPLIRHCKSNGLDFFVVHTGQHYSYKMDKIFFEELELPKPKYNLEVGSGKQGEQTAKILEKVEPIFLNEKPSIVLVQGDTNSVLAGALAATKLHIKVGHIEAGLRSNDKNMPEEINRIITDHISDFLFCPTKNSREIVLKEGIRKDKLFVTGNTIVDAVFQNLKISEKKALILKDLSLEKQNYILITSHRPSNVDSKDSLVSLFKGLVLIYEETKLAMIFPIHPRTKKMIGSFGLKVPSCIKMIDPVGFLEFLQLEANARLILTDSGGIQEEACILKVPCVTLRKNTERPETIEVGGNILVGTDPNKMLNASKDMLNSSGHFKNPFGNGDASKKIIEIIQDEI